MKKKILGEKWNLHIKQINDIYIDIVKNKNYSEKEIIDKVIIDNFKIENIPQKGEINLFRLTTENGMFNNKEEYKIQEELIYTGTETSNIENLEIANQGGLIPIRCINTNLGNYKSNEASEIRHDGMLLEKVGIKNEEIKFKISFDISIELKSEKRYKSNIELEMPKGNLVRRGNDRLSSR